MHVVRGHGQSKSEDVDLRPGGCGGCDYDISAFFVGTATLPNGASADVEAALTLATTNKQNLYDGKYHVFLRTDAFGAGEVAITGDFEQGQIVKGTLFSSASSSGNLDGGVPVEDSSLDCLSFTRTPTTDCPE